LEEFEGESGRSLGYSPGNPMLGEDDEDEDGDGDEDADEDVEWGGVE
jgi:hypothetical protein